MYVASVWEPFWRSIRMKCVLMPFVLFFWQDGEPELHQKLLLQPLQQGWTELLSEHLRGCRGVHQPGEAAGLSCCESYTHVTDPLNSQRCFNGGVLFPSGFRWAEWQDIVQSEDECVISERHHAHPPSVWGEPRKTTIACPVSFSNDEVWDY